MKDAIRMSISIVQGVKFIADIAIQIGGYAFYMVPKNAIDLKMSVDGVDDLVNGKMRLKGLPSVMKWRNFWRDTGKHIVLVIEYKFWMKLKQV